ncbi:MAG TPA: glycosyltransferase family 4 protein [Rhodopila sp.]|nr:glycosyltransferase family 4 protein [Rhodopila sp.]
MPIVFNWGVSSYFGWGLNGLNLALSLSAHPSFYPLVAHPFSRHDCVVDPLSLTRLDLFADRSAVLWDSLRSAPGDTIEIDAPVLIDLGYNLISLPAPCEKRLFGRPSVGVVFLEHATIDPEGRGRAEQLSLIIAGSRWNEQVLRANGIIATTTVLQGVDTTLFHPGPRTGRFRDRFVIFSGGKLEFRKGQDLVVKAFKLFHQRHPEALLVTAWGNKWDWRDTALAELTDTVPVQPTPDGNVDSARWALDNGIPPDALIALGRTPNIAMPHVLREADVGLFPNRCEGGTNLVAMECMACGVPVILSANTGHLDLLEPGDVALPLTHQALVRWDGADVEGWGESDVDEIVERLETVWRDRDAARSLGQRGSAFMATMTWDRQTERLTRALLPLMP